MISFEWDEAKNLVNIDKHGVSFSEAKSVFYDENAIQYFDDGHSEDEDRFLMLGLSNQLRMLLVVHSFRGEDSVIRIISARKATKRESMRYGV
jgi:hypothetical protein